MDKTAFFSWLKKWGFFNAEMEYHGNFCRIQGSWICFYLLGGYPVQKEHVLCLVVVNDQSAIGG